MTKSNALRPSRIITVFLLVCAVVTGGLTFSPPTSAACAAPSTNYGKATMKLTVATAGNYRLWTHMKAPDATNNSYLLGVDSNACVTVGDAKLATNTWSWVDYRDGATASKITVNLSAGTHTVTLIGREPNVKIDRILAAGDQNCVPSGMGENCMTQADSTEPVTTITMPDDLSTVTGTTSVKATATDNSNVAKVEFYVQGVLKATDTTSPYAYDWNTALVANGIYTISAKAYDAAGNSSMDARSITVKNGATQAPSAPVGVTAKAATPTSVSLQWQPGKATGSSPLRYRIVRDNVTIATVSTTSYLDKAVAAGTNYTYHVVAVDKDGNVSASGSAATVTTPALPAKDTKAPTRPTKLKAVAASAHQINLSWAKSTDNAGTVTYDIYRARQKEKATKAASTTSTSFGDAGLWDDTKYTYYVVARDAAGNKSAASAKESVTTKREVSQQQRTGVLRGTIKGRNGRSISGATVMVWVDGKRHQATTNWRGQYRIEKIPAGKYEIKVKARAYDTKTTTVRLSAGKTKWFDTTLRR